MSLLCTSGLGVDLVALGEVGCCFAGYGVSGLLWWVWMLVWLLVLLLVLFIVSVGEFVLWGAYRLVPLVGCSCDYVVCGFCDFWFSVVTVVCCLVCCLWCGFEFTWLLGICACGCCCFADWSGLG